ncbi:hypothetical protein MVES_003773 [Malassezia vespertilionis]|uniref:Uncharacterized protein n=1 Tax=Malassezia vespertilionis TaxID=2020962 RepID=A0A2N1J6W9_9BASI|nr:hypothetical protein MVES_003773 [Malassezia vespertilionis]
MSAFRATRALLQKTPESSHTYHYTEGKTPFWRWFRQMFSLNPEISSGLPAVRLNRNPPPGMGPIKPAIVPSNASDIAQNMYYWRDFRRNYPQPEVVTQVYLTKLLLASPNEDGTMSLPNPDSGKQGTTELAVPSDLDAPTAFTEVLEQVQADPKYVYSAKHLPPRFPSTAPQHILKIQKDAIPHPKGAYFPVVAQRFNLLLSYLLPCVSIACVFISLTCVSFAPPTADVQIKDIELVYGKARFHADARNQDFVETKMDIDMDLSSLFRWNTKQVLLSMAGAYSSQNRVRGTLISPQPENEVAFWDKIVRADDKHHLKLRGVRNSNITVVDFVLRWNVMPYVGFSSAGETIVQSSVPLPLVPEPSAQNLKYLRY